MDIDKETLDANNTYTQVGKLNFKCYIGMLRWVDFFQLYRSRTNRYQIPHLNDQFIFFSIKDNSANFIINETSYHECKYPEISYVDAVKLLLKIDRYPKNYVNSFQIETKMENLKNV